MKMEASYREIKPKCEICGKRLIVKPMSLLPVILLKCERCSSYIRAVVPSWPADIPQRTIAKFQMQDLYHRLSQTKRDVLVSCLVDELTDLPSNKKPTNKLEDLFNDPHLAGIRRVFNAVKLWRCKRCGQIRGAGRHHETEQKVLKTADKYRFSWVKCKA
jgi:ribosomal protein L37AE/L43A